jgi:hypothetical protein
MLHPEQQKMAETFSSLGSLEEGTGDDTRLVRGTLRYILDMFRFFGVKKPTSNSEQGPPNPEQSQ